MTLQVTTLNLSKKQLLLMGLLFSLTFSLYAQRKYDYLLRTDLSYEERVNLGETYFETNNKERGNGYSQFQRWKYWAGRSLQQDGMVLEADEIAREYDRFNQRYGDNEGSVRVTSGNFIEMGPTSATNTSTWSSALGRLTSIAFGNTFNHVIVGAPSGGVWKTLNGGNSWIPLFDDQPDLNVLEVEINPFNDQHYLVGTNDAIYRSTNGGATWTTVLSGGNNRDFNTIRVHPTDGNIVYALGRDYDFSISKWVGKVYKSTNGGISWNDLYIATEGQLYDLEFKPNNPATFYVSGIGTIYRTTNSGSSFIKRTSPFLSDGVIMMAVSPANPNYVYAIQENNGGFYALFASTNSGVSYSVRSDNSSGTNNIFYYDNSSSGGQAPRDMDVIVSPTNINEVHAAGVEGYKSTNGGATWTQTTTWLAHSTSLPFIHADIDALYYVTRNGQTRIYAATDGGIFYSSNNGGSFTDLTQGIGVRQFYRISVSKTTEDWVCGGSQDNGTGVVKSGNWYDWVGADGMECIVDYTNPNIMYATSQFGSLYKTTNGGNTLANTISNPPGSGNWITPFEQHPANSNILYVGYGELYRSSNGGSTWVQISNFSLSEKLRELKIAPSNPNIIYAAFNERLFKTLNGGNSWTEITPPGFSYYGTNFITVHPSNPNRLILALSYASDGSRVLESTNGGASWNNISSNLPNISAQCAIYQGDADDAIYVGMSRGIYFKDNVSGNTWTNIGITRNLPNVMVSEIEIQHNKLYVATYGRGLWNISLADECIETMTLNGNIANGMYTASDWIQSTGTVNAGDDVTFNAGNYITLNPDFHATTQSVFLAEIQSCVSSSLTIPEEEHAEARKVAQIQQDAVQANIEQEIRLQVIPNPTQYESIVRFYTKQPKTPSLIHLYNVNGQAVIEQKIEAVKGWNHSSIDVSSLPAGIYIVKVFIDNQQLTEKLQVSRH